MTIKIETETVKLRLLPDNAKECSARSRASLIAKL